MEYLKAFGIVVGAIVAVFSFYEIANWLESEGRLQWVVGLVLALAGIGTLTYMIGNSLQ